MLILEEVNSISDIHRKAEHEAHGKGKGIKLRWSVSMSRCPWLGAQTSTGRLTSACYGGATVVSIPWLNTIINLAIESCTNCTETSEQL